MIKNYLIVALRNMYRQKGYSLINVVGLAVGMAAGMLIMLWVQNELSYDRFHEKADRIYRVVLDDSGVTPPPMAPALTEQIPGIVSATRFRGLGSALISHGAQSVSGNRLTLVDPEFFDVFTYSFILGEPAAALEDSRAVVLTESLARRCFGDESPLGKTLRLDNKFDMHVSGVIADVVDPSVLEFDLLVRTDHLIERWGENFEEWKYSSYRTFVVLEESTSPAEVTAGMTALYNERVPDNPRECGLQPLTDMHLYQVSGEPGAIVYVYVFLAIALAVLAIACLNFINLTTARGTKRALEVGIRKVVGASRASVIRQFLGESVLLSLLAFVVAVGLVELAAPAFSGMAGTELALGFDNGPWFVAAAAAVALGVGLAAGIFPAVYMATFGPKGGLSRAVTSGRSSRSPLRRVLVLSQYVVSILLIIGTLTIGDQLDYLKRADLGFDRDHIICLETNSDQIVSIAPAFQELLSHAQVESATICGTLPGRRESSTNRLTWEGQRPEEHLTMEIIYTNYGFTEVFGIEMAEGRFYDSEYSTDVLESFVVNEAAVRAMGFTNQSAIGKRFSLYDKSGYIVGVVKDFHSRSLHNGIDPLIFQLNVYPDDNLVFRLNPVDMAGTLAYMESVWRKYAPDYPFEYKFLDETLDALYRAEQRMGKIGGYLSGLAIFIACLGLLGMASFMASQRTKEIGVRKVLGASVTNVVRLLAKEFVVVVIVANVVASPIAYYVMNLWLDRFVYRTEVSPITLVAVGLATTLLALGMVILQTYQAAVANPVKALKYE